MLQQELNKLMADTARDAVENADEQLSITLDYSPESIEHVDTIIHHYLDSFRAETLDNKVVFTLCHMFGAYVGETYKKLVGGEWEYDDSDENAPIILLHYQEKSFAFAGICYERLVKDSTISVKKYFDLALDFATH